MSEKPPEFHWHIGASDEVERQFQEEIHPYLLSLIRSLAQDAAVDSPTSPDLQYVVHRQHVQAAAQILLNGWSQARTATPAVKYELFISYSSDDLTFVSERRDKLEQQGVRCFLDIRDVRTGDRWLHVLQEAIRDCLAFAIVLTPNALSRDAWWKFEAGAAFSQNKKTLTGLRYVRQEDLPDPLKYFQAQRLENAEDQDGFIVEVLDYIRGCKHRDE